MIKINKEDIKKQMSEEQYNVCFLKGTEPPFSGKYTDNKVIGIYICAVCGKKLFESDKKYDSGTGWPSFWDFAEKGTLKEVDDNTLGMSRTEVRCANCDSHLGHVFNDGPKSMPDGTQATGLRYCINSLSLDFKPEKK